MKRTTSNTAIALAAATLIGLAATGAAVAHGTGSPGGQGAGPQGQGMGPGMGQGMMQGGQGTGMGMMGGYKGGHMGGPKGDIGMMGGGHMQGAMMGHMLFGGGTQKEMTPDRVTAIVTGMLAMHGPDTLKVGKVEATDDAITAEIVTKDGSLVQKIEFDKKTGAHHPVN